MPPCLTLSIVGYGIKGKVEQSKERSSALPYTIANEKGPFGSPSTKFANRIRRRGGEEREKRKKKEKKDIWLMKCFEPHKMLRIGKFIVIVNTTVMIHNLTPWHFIFDWVIPQESIH